MAFGAAPTHYAQQAQRSCPGLQRTAASYGNSHSASHCRHERPQCFQKYTFLTETRTPWFMYLIDGRWYCSEVAFSAGDMPMSQLLEALSPVSGEYMQRTWYMQRHSWIDLDSEHNPSRHWLRLANDLLPRFETLLWALGKKERKTLSYSGVLSDPTILDPGNKVYHLVMKTAMTIRQWQGLALLPTVAGLNCESEGDLFEIVLGGECALVAGFADSVDWCATELYRNWNLPEFRNLWLESEVMTHVCMQRNEIQELVQFFLQDRLRCGRTSVHVAFWGVLNTQVLQIIIQFCGFQ